jgi:flagellar FliL protein
MAEDKDIAEQAQRGGRKKLIIILAAVLVLLIAAAGAAYFLLANDDGQAGTDVEDVAEVEKPDPLYLKLDPAFVVNLPPGGSVKVLQISIDVMTRTPTVIETLQANEPMVRHHVLNLLEQQQAADLMTVEGREALQQGILDLLAEKLNSLKEPGAVEGVFFTQFVMQ